MSISFPGGISGSHSSGVALPAGYKLVTVFCKTFRYTIRQRLPDYALVVGNPGVLIGRLCKCGGRLTDDLSYLACGNAYTRNENGLTPILALR